MDRIRSVDGFKSIGLGQIGQLIAAGLVGFGIIVLIAANWDGITTFQRFGLVGVAGAISALSAMAMPSIARAALLVSFAATGGMLALIGQTYQTGADAWQLFAYWAALGLPFALAARSDAVWTPWIVVSATAVGLWAKTFGWAAPMPSLLGLSYEIAASWLMMLALAAAMLPATSLDRLLGGRKWAGRLALLLALAQVGAHGMEAVLAYRPNLLVYSAALAVCAGIAWALVARTQRDLMLIAASALAIDALLVAGLGRLLLDKSKGGQTLGFIAVGLAAAGIVAVSVVGIMRLIEPRKAAAGDTADASKRPWPIVVLSGIGAMMAAIPFLVSVALMFGSAFDKGPVVYLLGAGVAAASYALLKQPRGLFVEQLAVVGLVTGLLLISWGVFRDLPIRSAGLLFSAITIGLAISIGRPWLAALLAAASTGGLAAALTSGSLLGLSPAGMAIAWSVIACAGLAACAGLIDHRNWLQPLGQDFAVDGTLDAATSGWLAGSLAGLAASQGMTFMVGANVFGGVNSTLAATGPLLPARVVSFVLAAAGMAYVWRTVPALRSQVASAIMVAAVLLSIAMPALGATVLVLAAAIALRKRTLAALSVVAVLWIIGAFYYSLALPLTQKGLILIAVGAMLGIVATFAREETEPADIRPVIHNSPATAVRGLAAAGLLLVGFVSVDSIRAKEALIRDGRPVFVELAPVDPRSIMQGDYMALRFQLPREAQSPAGVRAVHAIGKVDEKGVVRLTRVGDTRTKLDDGEIAIELNRKRGRWMLVTDAWFFKEGTAKKWESARYGELRVMPDGSALLVGLADKDLVAIRK